MSVWNGTFSSYSFSTSADLFPYFSTEPPNEVLIFDWWDYYYTTAVLLTLWEVGQWVKMSVGQAWRGTAWDSWGAIFFFNSPHWPGALGSKILSGAIYEHVIAASALFCWGTYVESAQSKEKLMPLSNDQTLFMRSHRLLDGDHFPTWSRWYLAEPDIIARPQRVTFFVFPVLVKTNSPPNYKTWMLMMEKPGQPCVIKAHRSRTQPPAKGPWWCNVCVCVYVHTMRPPTHLWALSPTVNKKRSDPRAERAATNMGRGAEEEVLSRRTAVLF